MVVSEFEKISESHFQLLNKIEYEERGKQRTFHQAFKRWHYKIIPSLENPPILTRDLH